ncbi:alpha/beta hydrolase [Nocardioides sp. KC13]|uniref:Alpha/beta hydrolase n=1 Tax=Nocardioides turkmenicus TaxID=2711220 RepID=A0A6M1R2L5_9ACTN|nr:alpha/beta hydrolase [Nocardioides sp. KC13]NGN94150.1 alpha/beta hydrolase [Nocardioides sp. KC13]
MPAEMPPDMPPSTEIQLSATASHVFVEHYPGLVYRQFIDGRLFPGGRELHFDLLKPVSPTPTPLVVFVKGGGFQNVHRSRYLPALVPLAQRGITIASVEYRTSNEARFPAPVDDVQHAIRYIRTHAQELNVLTDAIAVWGNSAGGTIAAIIGAAGVGGECGVRAAVSWYGVHDPARSERYRDPDSPIRHAFGPGDDGAAPWPRPSDHVHPGSAPMLLIHGTEDEVVDVEQSQSLARELVKQGVPHELALVKGGRHSFAQMCTRTDALARTFSFLEQHLTTARP